MHACVARPVRKDEIAREKDAQDAEAKEWDNLKKMGFWDPTQVREFNEVARTARRNNTKVHLGRIFGLMVEKGSELLKGDPRRRYKYRVVFQGNNVVDQHWETAIFQDLGSSPASMEAGKMADAYGSFPGHNLQQADAEQAYIQANLEGEETWVELPEAAWRHSEHEHLFLTPEGKPKYTRPSVRLRKALYGHPDAGTCWERYCDRCVLSQGFEPIPDWPSCYFHPKYKLFLMVYVDDFKLAGPEEHLEKGWDLIRRSGLIIEKPTGPGLFLGCVHERFERKVNGRTVRGFSYNMGSYLRDTVLKYCEMVQKLTGTPVNLGTKKQAPTPFLPEDQKSAPAGRPLSESKACACPSLHAFLPCLVQGRPRTQR